MKIPTHKVVPSSKMPLGLAIIICVIGIGITVWLLSAVFAMIVHESTI